VNRPLRYVPVGDYGIQKFKKAKKLDIKIKLKLEAGEPFDSNRSRFSALKYKPGLQ